MMPRQIRDASGVTWIVWQVTPPMRPRRDVDTVPVPISWGQSPAQPARLEPGYSDGWLAFKCATERRRLSPYPKGWEWRTEDELLALLEQATPAAVVGPAS